MLLESSYLESSFTNMTLSVLFLLVAISLKTSL